MSQDIPRDASHGSAFDVVARSDDAQRGNVVSLPTTAELDSHPVAALFPLMDVASPEFEDLVADVREHGLRESIRLYEGKILDGRNRYRACRHAGVEPRFEEWSGDSPVLHVLTANFRQRSLTDDQKAMFFVCAWEKYQEEVSLPVGYKRPHWHNVMLSAASRMATLQHGAEHVERTVRNRAAAGDSEAMCIIRQIERRAWRDYLRQELKQVGGSVVVDPVRGRRVRRSFSTRRKDATGRVIGTHVDPYTDKPWDELAELLDQETALIDTLMLNVAVQRHALRLRRYAPHAHTPAEAAELLRRTGTWAPDGPFA